MIEFGNFEFIFGVRGPKFNVRKNKTNAIQNRGEFFIFIFGWGQFLKDRVYDCVSQT